MDFARALTFPFDDEDWITKTVIGSLAMLVGIVLPFIPMGYQVYITRSVIRGKKRLMPAADDLGEVLTDGLMTFIAWMIYAMPVALPGCAIAMMGEVMGGSDLGGMLFLCLLCCVSVFFGLYLLAAGALFNMGIIRYGETGNFVEFVRIGALWADVREHLGTLIGLFVYLFVFALLVMVLLPFGLALCGVGLLVLVFYASLVSGHLLGQAGLEILEKEDYAFKGKRGN